MLNVILDLDSTCIFAVEYHKLDEIDQRAIKQLRYLDHYDNGVPIYRIFERPGLQQFLTYLFTNFNVAVWTAAEYNYGKDIVNNFILNHNPNRHITFFFAKRMFEQAAIMYNTPKRKFPSKPLEFIYSRFPGWHSCNTYIIDDNPDVYRSNPTTCLKIKPFNIISENGRPISGDTFLKDKSLADIYHQLEENRKLDVSDCWLN